MILFQPSCSMLHYIIKLINNKIKHVLIFASEVTRNYDFVQYIINCQVFFHIVFTPFLRESSVFSHTLSHHFS